MAPELIEALPDVPRWIVGDRGYSSHEFRTLIRDKGATPVIPPKRNEEQIACPDWAYRNRHLVENFWARIKEWRAVATRYEKTATSFLGILSLASVVDWLKI